MEGRKEDKEVRKREGNGWSKRGGEERNVEKKRKCGKRKNK